ncbi:NUC119 domain-containing protein [Mycena metata]|uniref:NUC119 domain-containing protein n=1 Tax=Mycena metata TaxID=1033252 RepID=A0AAD7H9W3_9AGAR|nr:NUC119 domain-containing protein [Mycena metata]
MHTTPSYATVAATAAPAAKPRTTGNEAHPQPGAQGTPAPQAAPAVAAPNPVPNTAPTAAAFNPANAAAAPNPALGATANPAPAAVAPNPACGTAFNLAPSAAALSLPPGAAAPNPAPGAAPNLAPSVAAAPTLQAQRRKPIRAVLYARKGLAGVLEGADPDRRKRVLASMKEALTSIFNNSDKGAVTHAVVHQALWEYIVAVNSSCDEADAEKQLREIFEVKCQDVLAELVHTKDGSRVVREFLARGNAKDRKQILKVLKPHVEHMCIDDDAQLVLFTALDVIERSSRRRKGGRTLLYLLVPRTRRHFMPAQIALLAETDDIRAKTSKKTRKVREAEVRAGASEALIKWVKDKGALLLRETAASLVVTEIMLFAEGDKTGVIETLLHAASAAYPCAEEDAPHPIDLPHAARLYKTLLQGGHFNRSSGATEQSTAWDGAALTVKFVEAVLMGKEEEEAKEARKTLKGWFGKEVVKEIEGGETKGKKVLLEKIAAL